ncbi:MAG: addiction module protein [Sedimentisphaerales bacterium]|nr:addiction module protein [Sedimentisphaerales bacterium]
MMAQSQQIFREALDLSPIDRAGLVEQIPASFDSPARENIDAAWGKEAEDRITAYEQGKIGSSAASEVFREIERQARE